MRGLDTLVDSLLKFDPYLTAGDVAFLMGRHANTILLAMSKGEIPVSTGPGERPRVKLSTLMEWGNANKNTFEKDAIRKSCYVCKAPVCGNCKMHECQGC
jgi:hypothetical protein